MAVKFSKPSKKTAIISIIAIIVILAIAITGTVVFLKDRGTTEAIDLNTEQADRREDNIESNSNNEQTSNEQTELNNELTNGQEQNTERENSNQGQTNNVANSNTESNTNISNGANSNTERNTNTNNRETSNNTRQNENTNTSNVENIQETTITRTETTDVYQTYKEQNIGWNPIEIETELASANMNIKTANITASKSNTAQGKVKPGDEFEYIITVINNGNIDGNIHVTDNIPEQLEVLSTTPEIKDLEKQGNKLDWGEITIKPEEEKKIIINVKVKENASGDIKNIAKVGNEDVEDPDTIEIEEIKDFEISKESKLIKSEKNTNEKYAKIAEVGDTIHYTISVKNTGNVTLNDLLVKDETMKQESVVSKLNPGEKIIAIEFDHIIKPEDIRIKDTQTIVYNKAIAIAENEERQTENEIEARNDYEYRVEYYYDNNEMPTYIEKVSDVALNTIITSVDTKTHETMGYKLDKINELPFTITSNNEMNVIKVYYVKDASQTKTLTYKVEYYKDGEKVEDDTITESKEVWVNDPDTIEVKEFDKSDDRYTGYKFEKTEPETIPTEVESGTTIKVYYVKDASQTKTLTYKVEYYKDGEKVEDDTITESKEVWVNDPDTIEVKEFDKSNDRYTGYKFEKTEPETVPTEVESGTTIKVYYVKDASQTKTLTYKVEYYKDGEKVEDDTITESKEVWVNDPDTIEVKEFDKSNDRYTGYKFEKTEPETVPTEVESGTTIKVYYVKISDIQYTIYYYYNGKLDESKTENLTAEYEEKIDTYPSKPEYNNEIYTIYNVETTNENKEMPLIIGMEKNEIHVYYGKTEVTVEKTAKATITNGEDIIYTITVTNKGFIPATGVTVTDILPEELEQIEEISDKGSLNADKTKIIWNIDIPANNGKTPGVKTLTVKAKTKKSTIGKTIKNEVELGGTEQGSSTCTTNVNKKKINITEVTEGKDAENVNIIFLMDNSSSMNEPIIGKSYSNNGANHVAPSDMNKTRIYSAKQATSEFINNIYSDAKMKDTNMAVITFNKSGEESTTNVEITGKGPYDEIYREKRKYYVIEQDGTKTEIDIDDYEKATDGKYYEIKKQSISTGAHEVGRATSTNWTDLKNQVEKITIGNRRDGLGTNISPALKKAKTIISEYKEQNNNRNIVIVLGDGAINDTYTNSLNSLKGADGADAIYSIGFGADAANENKTAYKQLAKISTNNKVYTAQNTQELIKQFLSILEDIKPNGEQTTGESTLIKDIKPGEIAFKLSKDLKISATTPLIITNNNNEVIKCTKQTELIEYGIRYDATNKIIRWDLNECLEKNSALDLSGTLKLKYYIPLN